MSNPDSLLLVRDTAVTTSPGKVQLQSQPESRIQVLVAWCTTNGIHIDPRLELRERPRYDSLSYYEKSLGVYALENISSGVTLVRIPKRAVLSARNCTLAAHIPHAPYGREAALALSLALLGEILLGQHSRWAGYLSSLPRSVDIGFLWDAEEMDAESEVHTFEPTGADASDERATKRPRIIGQEGVSTRREDHRQARIWMKGTELEKTLNGTASSADDHVSLLDDARAYWSSVAEHVLRTATELKAAGTNADVTLSAYLRAYSLVSSRAFMIDAYHGLAMVPIADAFNHELYNHVHLETEHHVCNSCGSLQECEHDQDEVRESNDSVNLGDHTPTGVPTAVPAAATAAPGHEEDTCDMVSNAVVEGGQEVFNTYGDQLTNADLIARYGFAIQGHENDCLWWSWEEALEFADDYIKRHGPRPGVRNGAEVMRLLKEVGGSWPPSLGLANVFDEFHAEGSRVLGVNGEGMISESLWVYCGLLDIGSNPEGLRKALNGEADEEESIPNEEDEPLSCPYDVVGGYLSGIGIVVAELCDTRRKGMAWTRNFPEEIWNMEKALPTDMTRMRLAAEEFSKEVSILERCDYNWTEWP